MLNRSHTDQISRLTQLKERKKHVSTHELIKRWNQQQGARELLRLFDMAKLPEPRR